MTSGSYDAEQTNRQKNKEKRLFIPEPLSLFFEQVKHAPAASLTLFIGSVKPWVAVMGIFVHPALNPEPDTHQESWHLFVELTRRKPRGKIYPNDSYGPVCVCSCGLWGLTEPLPGAGPLNPHLALGSRLCGWQGN